MDEKNPQSESSHIFVLLKCKSEILSTNVLISVALK